MNYRPYLFLLRAALFAGIAGVTFWIATSFADKGLRRSRHQYFATWNALYDGSINADILVLGNSHSHVSISPAILDSCTGSKSYNLAMDGYQFDMQQARYAAYRLHNRKPKMIIQGLDYFILDRSGIFYDVPQFLPYLNRDTLVYDALLAAGMSPSWGALPFLKYREQRHALLRGWRLAAGAGENADTVAERGYAPKTLPFFSGDYRRKIAGDHLQPEYKSGTVQHFERFLAQCKREGIAVVLVLTPQYEGLLKHYRYREIFTQQIQQMADRQDAVFLDWSISSPSHDSNNFYIASHLNKRGAEIFSRELGGWLIKNSPPCNPEVNALP